MQVLGSPLDLVCFPTYATWVTSGINYLRFFLLKSILLELKAVLTVCLVAFLARLFRFLSSFPFFSRQFRSEKLKVCQNQRWSKEHLSDFEERFVFLL